MYTSFLKAVINLFIPFEAGVNISSSLFVLSASMFLISSVKAPEKAQTMVFKELQHADPGVRINAVLR